MMNDTSAKLLDVVALLKDKPVEGLVAGHVGTIVETGAGGSFLVEFLDRDGYTFSLTELRRDELLVLKYEPVLAA